MKWAPDRVRAVLFDLDGTLYRQRPLRALMAIELLSLPLTAPLLASRRLKALSAYRKAQESMRHRASTASPEGQLQAAATASGLPVTDVDALVTEWMQQRPLKYLQYCRAPGLPPFLDRLERLGILAGVLSDYPARAKLGALGLGHRFSPVLCSTDPEVGAFKPSPRGFLRACEIWDLPPAEVLFVGDRPDVDAAGAAAAGMPCVIMGSAAFPSFERLSRVFDGR